MLTQRPKSHRDNATDSIIVFITLAGVVAGLTLLFLGMRSIMEIGGACAEGGPFVPARPCPEGTTVAIFGGLWGGIACLAVYVWKTWSRNIPGLLGFAWPALFLSLGWNFLEFGLNPPGDQSLAWGWLICAAMFAVIGAVPLWVVGPIMIEDFFPRRNAPARSTPRATDRILGTVIDGSPPDPEPTPPPKTPRAGGIESLERLAALHRSGSLTDFEFEEAKRRLLRGEL